MILISAGLFFTYIDPAYQKIGDLRGGEKQYNEALNKSKELRMIRDQLLSKYNTFSTEDVSDLGKFLPDNVDNVRLIMEIDNLASKYGAIVRSVNVAKSLSKGEKETLGPKIGDFDSITLDFAIEAPYANFVKFLNDLTNGLRIVDVANLSFESSELGFYKYRLSVKTYWLK